MSEAVGSAMEVSRRSVLTLFGGAAFAVSMGGALTACSTSSTPAGTSTGGGTPVSTALSGVITQQVPTSLDPLTNSQTSAAWNSAPAHDWLEYVGVDGQLYPSLAETAEQVSPTTVRYKLRSEALFHDGSAVNAQAVKDLIDWVKEKKNAAWLQSRFQPVTVKVVDDLTFDLVLDQPDASFRSVLPRLPIVSLKSLPQQANSPSGCGPFRFVKWVQGTSVEYKKDPQHRDAAKIAIDSINIRHFADSNAGTQAFTSGKTNFCFPASLAQATALRKQADSGAFKFLSLEQGVSYLAINNKRDGFSDPRVRKAMRLVMNREQIVTSAFNRVGRPYYAFVPPESPFYSKSLEYPRDVAAAKALMAEAGVSVPPVKIYSPNVDYFQGMATIIKANLAEIGIEVQVQVEDVSATIKRAFNSKDFDLLVLADAVEPEVSTLLDYYVASDGSRNVGQYSSAAVDKLLEEGRATTDQARRIPIYQKAMQIAFLDDTAIVPLTTEALPLLVRSSNMDEVTAGGIAYWKFPLAKVTGG